jgi:hypothetical protein
VLGYSYIIVYRFRHYFGKDRGPGIALLNLRAVPILRVLLRYVILDSKLLYSKFISLDFIEAHDVRVSLIQEGLQTSLGEDSVDTVDIPMPNVDLAIFECPIDMVVCIIIRSRELIE